MACARVLGVCGAREVDGAPVRALVTLAPDVEPYASGARALEKVAHLAGWEFLALGDADLQGDRPWQAKRFAVRRGFELGANRVVWCDSDVEVLNPIRLAELLNGQGPEGVWTYHGMDLGAYWEDQARRNAGSVNAGFLRQAGQMLYGRFRRDLPPGALRGKQWWMFEDWFVGYSMDPGVGLWLCDEWDRIAELLRRGGVTWSDGVSVALAAAEVGVPVVEALDGREVCGSIRHLLNSFTKGLYTRTGEMLP